MRSNQPPTQAPPAAVMSSWSLIADPEEGQSPLASGWEVRQDPTTGAVYYYNPESGEMSQSRPQQVTGTQVLLVSEWEERVDPETGQVFYYDKSTGMKSITPPKPAPSAATMSTWAAVSDPEASKGPLASGWEVRQDPV